MGLELRSVDSDSSGLCPVDSGSLWYTSYPNLRTGSWSNHPCKQYNYEPIWVRPGVVCGRT
jgi:hypothetical protein